MREDPLHLLPPGAREEVYADLNRRFDGEYRLAPTGKLCPVCRFYYDRLMRESGGDFGAVERAVECYRFVFSEQDRVGIGTFQPKDEKNQDSTELTGRHQLPAHRRVRQRQRPAAFNFDGEFHVANRGLVEFIEILKLDVAFLYDLLGATQEHAVKPKKFAQTDIDEVILGHTNSPEFRRLQNNELMEAFRDRTTRIDVPYNIRLSDEVRIYRKTFGGGGACAGRHLAPHALEAAGDVGRAHAPRGAQEPRADAGAEDVPVRRPAGEGLHARRAAELRAEAPAEGMTGVSPRFIQDRVAAALVADGAPPCLTGFDVLDSLDTGLLQHPLIDSEEQRRRYSDLVGSRARGARGDPQGRGARLRGGRRRGRAEAVLQLRRRGDRGRERPGLARRAPHARHRGEDRRHRGPQGRLPARRS
jgi:serine protein kinase